MDEIKNLFPPGAGAPLGLVGRHEILEQAHVLFGRVRIRKAEKSILINGLHGAGKTALLNEIDKMARSEGYKTIFVGAHEEKPLAELLVPALKKTLFELDCLTSTGSKAKRGLRVLKSFIASSTLNVTIGLDIKSERGLADSGDLELDLGDLFESVAEAALEQQTLIALIIDDAQCLKPVELSALIMSLHRLQQRQLPLALVGAGLPMLPKLMGNSKAYAERLFSFPSI